MTIGVPRSGPATGARAVVLLVLLGSAPAAAHEPVFGIGPETIYQGGLGVELGVDFAREGGGRDRGLHTEFLFGVTEDLSLTLELPVLLRRERETGRTSGLGDVLLRGKFQFWRQDWLGGSRRAAAILGVKVPTGDHHRDVPLGSGSFDAVAGTSVAHESRRWYGFATARYVFRSRRHGLDRGDRVRVEVAGGVRPWLTGYLDPDLVVLLEVNAERAGRDRRGGRKLPDTGGLAVFAGPTALLSYRNWMVKGGVQVPVAVSLHGDGKRPGRRAILALEYHF